MTQISNLTNYVMIGQIKIISPDITSPPPKLPVHKPFEKWCSLDYPNINGM